MLYSPLARRGKVTILPGIPANLRFPSVYLSSRSPRHNDWGEIRTLGAFWLSGIQSRRTRPTMRPSHTTQDGFEPSGRFRPPDFGSGAINQLCH